MFTLFSIAVMGFIGLWISYGVARFALWLQGKDSEGRPKARKK